MGHRILVPIVGLVGGGVAVRIRVRSRTFGVFLIFHLCCASLFDNSPALFYLRRNFGFLRPLTKCGWQEGSHWVVRRQPKVFDLEVLVVTHVAARSRRRNKTNSGI